MSAERVKGKLLVAMPTLQDPNFMRTVVFMIEHNDEGALGVILNRPVELFAGELLDRWSDVLGSASLAEGGPVSTDSAVCLARPRAVAPSEETTVVIDGVVAVNLDADPAIVAAYIDEPRVFIGYAGWGTGQLEAEIAEGGWIVTETSNLDVFDPDPSTLWTRVMLRQPGKLKLLATFPADPKMN